jgi:hypothetical protein
MFITLPILSSKDNKQTNHTDFRAIEPDSKPSFNREINDSKMWFAIDYYSTFKRNSLKWFTEY